MNKLIITLVATALGVAANAASYTWSTSGRLYDGSGNSGAEYYVSGKTAYLIFASVVSQDDLVRSFLSDSATAQSTVATKSIASAAVDTEGKISSTATYDTTAQHDAYFVIFNGDKMYVSGTAVASYDVLNPTEVKDIAFGAQTSVSKATFDDSTTTYSGAGWYAVPEPTSGLLLLIGVAGLSLKRKRA